MLCVEYNKGTMTSKEALSNIGEMIDSGKTEEEVQHLFELADRVMDKEQPFDEWDDDSQLGVLDELDSAFGTEKD